MKNRIWELDALRGVFILGMLAIHLVFDLTGFGILSAPWPDWFVFIQRWGGSLFFLLSGICATLGHRSIRRGLVVFAAGMICTAVTYWMARLRLSSSDMIIRFGVLHCLGICMLLWPLFSRMKKPLLFALGISLVALGLYFATIRVEVPYLFFLGLRRFGFMSGDYFPLFPFFGFFLVGAGLGKCLYHRQTTLLPRVNTRNLLIRFFCRMGKWSLWIYLAHQPIIYLICTMISSR